MQQLTWKWALSISHTFCHDSSPLKNFFRKLQLVSFSLLASFLCYVWGMKTGLLHVSGMEYCALYIRVNCLPGSQTPVLNLGSKIFLNFTTNITWLFANCCSKQNFPGGHKTIIWGITVLIGVQSLPRTAFPVQEMSKIRSPLLFLYCLSQFLTTSLCEFLLHLWWQWRGWGNKGTRRTKYKFWS